MQVTHIFSHNIFVSGQWIKGELKLSVRQPDTRHFLKGGQQWQPPCCFVYHSCRNEKHPVGVKNFFFISLCAYTVYMCMCRCVCVDVYIYIILNIPTYKSIVLSLLQFSCLFSFLFFHLCSAWTVQLLLSLFCIWISARSGLEGVIRMKTSGSWHPYNSFAKHKLHIVGIFNWKSRTR